LLNAFFKIKVNTFAYRVFERCQLFLTKRILLQLSLGVSYYKMVVNAFYTKKGLTVV